MYHIGVDLGGTNIKTGIVDDNYNIIATDTVKTKTGRSPEKIADDIALSIENAIEKAGIKKSDIKAVGIGSPGAVDSKNGIVHRATNLGFFELPLCDMLKQRTGFDFYIENDANSAAYGEFLAGAGKGKNSLIAMTLGTGVGGGIVLDGKIYSGCNGAAGELGHIIIHKNGLKCSCGRHGCLEAYASATALIKQTKKAMKKNPDSLMWKLVNSNIENVNGRTAFDGMRQGDEIAQKTVDNYLGYVATGAIDMINIFQPDVFCIGGGISNEKDYLLIPVKAHYDHRDFCKDLKVRTQIKIAELGNNAGMIGAAFLSNLHK